MANHSTGPAAPSAPLRPDMPAIEGYADVLVRLARDVEAAATADLGDPDGEALHALRVAVRRSRAVLRSGKRVLPPGLVTDGREEFGRLGALTGPARDLDVVLLSWDDLTCHGVCQAHSVTRGSERELVAVRSTLEQRRAAAHDAVAIGLRSLTERGWLDEWRTRLAAATDGPIGDHGARPLGRVVARQLARGQSRLLDDGRAIGRSSPPERLHTLRKDAKRVRYLLECFDDLTAAAPTKRPLRKLKGLQDVLGGYQDAQVHAALLREVAEQLHDGNADAATLVAIGQLVERLDHERHASQERFADRFDAYDSRKTRRAMRAVITAMRA